MPAGAPAHPAAHLIWGAALALGAVAAMALLPNRVIRRRLRLTVAVAVAYLGLHVLIVDNLLTVWAGPAVELEKLLLALAIINTVVALAFNPWFSHRTIDRAPAIVQDFVVVAVFGVVATVVIGERIEMTSTVAAAVIGFALQEQLGNAFAGLAIQIEKPFRVGQWITVGSYEGVVTEVTWRATKLRTKMGNMVVVPNSSVAKEAITNYSEPQIPTRIWVDVGAGYGVPPNDVREALHAAMRRVSRVLPSPAPDVLFHEFGDSALIYRARFWIDQFEFDEFARDEVRTAIFYEFYRRGIEVPWPIRVLYERKDAVRDSPERREAFARTVAAVPVLASLDADAHRALAQAAEERLFADGEVIVREGDGGSSMFLVRRGRAVVTVGPDRREVALIEPGGYFGEMSLLTGDGRTATVTARGDCVVLEISADTFREYVQSHPEVIDHLAAAAEARRRELEKTRAAAPAGLAIEPVSLAQRMRRFFGLQ
jgi:small-conductance mechanosensitive channel/CRP-like cAMP-binding protein